MQSNQSDAVITVYGKRIPSRRPLIGVPTGREESQRYHGLPIYIMNQTYIRALESLGALPILIPLHMDEPTLHGIFERLDGLLLAGGEDMDPQFYCADRHLHLGATDAERDRTEVALAQWAVAIGMPTLGVCRGIQVLNVACGGSLYQDLLSERPDLKKHDYFPPKFERQRISHTVQMKSNSMIASIFGKAYSVNSMHHQGIDRLGYGLEVTGHAEDGLMEVVENPRLPFVMGVQWHPEEFAATDNPSSQLFERFIAAAASAWRNEVSVEWTQQFWQSCKSYVSLWPDHQADGPVASLQAVHGAVDEAAA